MGGTAPPIPETVALEHPFFKPFEGPHFRLSEPKDGRAVFVGELGEQSVVVPLRGIVREYGIEAGSHDGIVLDSIERALRFVNVLRIGDPIPAEVRTGDASWEPEARHREFARQRVTMQLVNWLSGTEMSITDPVAIQKLFDDPATKTRVNTAFDEAAKALGAASKDEVASRVEALADDLSYIEALRSRYREVAALKEKLGMLRQKYRNQMSVVSEIDPVRRLIRLPVKQLGTQFELLDAQTGEVLALLKDLDAKRGYIREQRDDLRCRLLAWQEVIDIWAGVDPAALGNFGLSAALRELYRFLAPRFMPVDEWVLLLAQQDRKKLQTGAVMTW